MQAGQREVAQFNVSDLEIIGIIDKTGMDIRIQEFTDVNHTGCIKSVDGTLIIKKRKKRSFQERGYTLENGLMQPAIDTYLEESEILKSEIRSTLNRKQQDSMVS